MVRQASHDSSFLLDRCSFCMVKLVKISESVFVHVQSNPYDRKVMHDNRETTIYQK